MQTGLSIAAVRKLALALPDVEESTAYGAPAFRLNGNLLACIASHKSAEPNTLVVRIPLEDRPKFLAAHPEVVYLTDHYLNYPSILVRLSRVEVKTLRDLFSISRKFVSGEPPRKRRTSSTAAPS